MPVIMTEYVCPYRASHSVKAVWDHGSEQWICSDSGCETHKQKIRHKKPGQTEIGGFNTVGYDPDKIMHTYTHKGIDENSPD